MKTSDVHEAVLAMENPTLVRLKDFAKAAVKAQVMDALAKINTKEIESAVAHEISKLIRTQTLTLLGVDDRWSRIEVASNSILAEAIKKHAAPVVDKLFAKFADKVQEKMSQPANMEAVEKAYVREYDKLLSEYVRRLAQKSATGTLQRVLEDVGTPAEVAQAMMKEATRF